MTLLREINHEIGELTNEEVLDESSEITSEQKTEHHPQVHCFRYVKCNMQNVG